MFKSEREYLLKRAIRGEYEELADDLLDFYWRHVENRILLEEVQKVSTAELWYYAKLFERRLELLIWGWYGSQTFSTRYLRG